jgi:hypothetical protein
MQQPVRRITVTMHKYGDVRIVGARVVHKKGRVCAATPARDWEFPVSTIILIGEYTIPGGPGFDYFYVFVAGRPLELYKIPMEAIELVGFSAFFADLESALSGRLAHRLYASVDYAESIMWPPQLAGEPIFDYVRLPRGGPLGRLLDKVCPKGKRVLSAALQDELDCTVDWAD